MQRIDLSDTRPCEYSRRLISHSSNSALFPIQCLSPPGEEGENGVTLSNGTIHKSRPCEDKCQDEATVVMLIVECIHTDTMSLPISGIYYEY